MLHLLSLEYWHIVTETLNWQFLVMIYIYIYIYKILFWGDLKDLCAIFGSFKGQNVILGSLGQKHSFVKFWG